MASIEHKLLGAAIHDRSLYDAVEGALKERGLSDYGQIIWDSVRDYYARDSASNSVDTELLGELLANKYSRSADNLRDILGDCQYDNSVSGNIRELVTTINRRGIGNSLVYHLDKGDEARSIALMNEYIGSELDEDEEIHFGADDPLGDQSRAGIERIPLFPAKLDARLQGGVFRQSQVCVFARPNTGKSTFCINTAVALAKNGYKVLYITNEEPVRVVVAGCIARFVNKSHVEVLQDPRRYHSAAVEAGLGNISFREFWPGTVPDIKRVLDIVKPDVLVLDQLYNMALQSKEGAVQAFGTFSSILRSIAKEREIISIVVTQAGESAEKKMILGQADIEWSNTGVCAQMDLMIGIAASDQMKSEGRLMLSFPRWKFGPQIEPFQVNVDYAQKKIT